MRRPNVSAKKKETYALLTGMFFMISQFACDWMPGRPKDGPEVKRPDQVLSFAILYAQNCAACHGNNGQNGPAIDLANPEYQTLVDDATLRDITAKGQSGTLMPGFALSTAGPLTDQQIDVLVNGMRSNWRKSLAAGTVPPYTSTLQPNPQHGQRAYETFCTRCHGSSNAKPGTAGSVLDGTYLGLVSDQAIRTVIIAGRPDLGMPDWRNDVAGQPMSDQEITDVVAWLSSHRPKTPGQPYPAPKTTANNRNQHGAE
jgi:cytochrome c oxidase cbb3-type subunit 3/ubiquinol-cytochrome c reductase cytochrome c subunit